MTLTKKITFLSGTHRGLWAESVPTDSGRRGQPTPIWCQAFFRTSRGGVIGPNSFERDIPKTRAEKSAGIDLGRDRYLKRRNAMRIRNVTKFRTEDIRAFLVAAHKETGAPMDKTVRVVYSHRSYHWGCASYSGFRMTLSLPGDPEKLDLLEFARVIEHEIGHNLGLRHKDMDPAVRDCKQEVPWAKGLTLRVKEVKVKPPVDRVAQRETHVRKMQEKWEKKLESAKRHLKKWTKKVRYYDRKNAAAKK